MAAQGNTGQDDGTQLGGTMTSVADGNSTPAADRSPQRHAAFRPGEVAREMGDFLTLGPIRRAARHPQGLAFYLGLGAVVAFEVVEWPIAVAAAFAHALSHSGNQTAKELAEGLEA